MSLTHAPAYTLLAGSQLRLSPHQTFNFGEFPKFDETVLVDMDSVLSRDIPALLHALSAVEYEASVDWHSLPSLHADATRGSEARYVSTLETAKGLQVTLPYYRANKIAVMSFRSEADLRAAKAAAQ